MLTEFGILPQTGILYTCFVFLKPLPSESLALLFKIWICKPWLGFSLVRALSPYTKVVGSIPGQGTYKIQPMNAQVSGTLNFSVCLSVC